MSSANNSARLRLIYYKVREHRIEEAWKRFTNAGFKPLLIKGWAAAQNYDEPSERDFNDTDLAFAREEYAAAQAFLRTVEGNPAIDLHEELRQLDTLNFADLYAGSQIMLCGKTKVRVLRPEDHLRVLCVHWLIDGGAKKDKLRDIYYAVKNRPADFDWERCLNVVSRVRRRWIVCTIALAHKYLGLDVSDTPFAAETETVPEWLTRAVEKEWQSEVYIIPLHFVLNDRVNFWKQLKKRIPPNPVQATVEMEGDFDGSARFFYQIGNVLRRFKSFVGRIRRRQAEKLLENQK